jgi:hypothetical protein
MQQKRKNKTTSILLAVFLGFWTWLYTYKRDYPKFWISLGSVIMFALISLFYPDVLLVDWFVGLGIAVWAIVDTAVKKREWYDRY